MNITTLILVRHGETEVNKEGLMHKDADSAKLTKLGREQIKRTAKELKIQGVDKLFSSKEERAVESAKIISEILGIACEELDNLEERKWGELEGKSWGEISEVLVKMTLEERYTFVPGGGESWKDCLERLLNAINRVVERNMGSNLAIITHGSVIRMLIPSLLNEPKETSFNYDPPNASISVFEYDKSGGFSKVKLLDTSHL